MAGRFKVEAVFKAVDRVTAPLSRMQNRVGKFTRSMSRGLYKVNRALKKVLGGLKRGAKAAFRFGGVAVAAGVTAFAVALNKVAAAADNLAKRARRLKFPIEELQEWQFVAEQSGLSSELFDKSLEKFTKGLGEARAGTGTLTTMLKKANPALLEQLTSTESVADAFDIYLKAIRGTENQMDKTALATAAFGRTGAKFLNITEQSAAAIGKLRQEQRENGIITEKQAAAAEEYNDAVNSLKKSLGGLLQNVLIPMLPQITKTIRAWRDWITANKDLIRAKVAEIFGSIKEAILRVIETIKKLNKENSVFDRLKKIVSAISTAIGFLAKHGKTVLKVAAALIALSIILKTVAAIMAVVNFVMAANPITLIVVAILVLIAVIATLIIWWDELLADFLNLGPVQSALAIFNDFASELKITWSALGIFISDLWRSIVSIFDKSIAKITAVIDKVKSAFSAVTDITKNIGSGAVSITKDIGAKITGFFGSNKKEELETQTVVAAVSPGERIARSIEERRETSAAEITIKDETGRASVTGGRLGPGLRLQQTGAFE